VRPHGNGGGCSFVRPRYSSILLRSVHSGTYTTHVGIVRDTYAITYIETNASFLHRRSSHPASSIRHALSLPPPTSVRLCISLSLSYFPLHSPPSLHTLTAWSIHEFAGARQLALFPGLLRNKAKRLPGKLGKFHLPSSLLFYALRSFSPPPPLPALPGLFLFYYSLCFC